MERETRRAREKSKSKDDFRYGEEGLTKSKSIAIVTLMAALLVFQITAFVIKSTGGGSRNTDSGNRSAKWGNIPSNRYGSDTINATATGTTTALLFNFNPNTISADSLELLGFTPRQAQTIINYRNKGGRFRKREEFAKIYSVSEEMYDRLYNYISIPTPPSGNNGKSRAETDKTAKRDSAHSLMHKTIGTAEPKKPETTDKAEESPEFPKKERNIIIELNSADTTDLVKLYGIGKYYAEKIIRYRNRLGAFYSPEQLLEIDGIDSARYSGFSRNVTADPSAIKPFSLDTASRLFLMKHPYIGAYTARGIVFYRERAGKENCTLENIVKENIISEEQGKKLWFYLR